MAIRLCQSLPRSQASTVITRQLLRSATSVGANYRAVCRARSKSDFVAKMGIVLEEADESAYWIELLIAANKTKSSQSVELLSEANELVAIATSSIKTARQNSD